MIEKVLSPWINMIHGVNKPEMKKALSLWTNMMHGVNKPDMK
jgi:hypothetical protein